MTRVDFGRARVCPWTVALCTLLWSCSTNEGSQQDPFIVAGAQGGQAVTAGTPASGAGSAPVGGMGTTPTGGSSVAAGSGGSSPATGETASGGTNPLEDAAVPFDDGGMLAETAGPSCDKDLSAQPGQDECTAPLKPGDDRLCKQMIGGAMRQFYIYASPAFDPCRPASLIMDCHGLSESAEVHIGKEGFNLTGMMYPSGYGSGWRMAIQKDNAIVVTPQGINNSWSPASDVPFVNAAADTVEAIADIDPEREYVTGISMGGMMTVATGCDDATRWRGMAPIAMLSQTCAQLARPTPVISFHAMGDQLTSYSSDRTLMQRIADFNHCQQGPTDSVHYGGPNSSSDPVCYVMPNGVGDPDAADPFNVPLQPCPTTAPATDCVSWTQCDDGVEVAFCTVNSDSQPIGGHILYNNDTQLDLAEVAWPYFKKFWK